LSWWSWSRTQFVWVSRPPKHVRVLRDALPDRAAERNSADQTTLHQLNRLVEKRLEITRQGLDELKQHLRNGRTEDAQEVLNKIDEDLHLLRRRVRREVEDMMQGAREKTAPTVCRSR
jgi:hypothetical protein